MEIYSPGTSGNRLPETHHGGDGTCVRGFKMIRGSSP